MVSLFDTLAYTKRLRAAGIPEPQAEAQAEALAAAVTTELLTKQDLSEAMLRLDSRLESRFAGVDARFSVQDGRGSLLQWMCGFNIALTVTVLFKMFA